MTIQITFPELVIGRHIPTLVSIGFALTSPTTLSATAFVDKWARDAEGKVVKTDGRGTYRVLDGTTLEKLTALFRLAAHHKMVFAYDQRISLPGIPKLFGTPLCKSSFMTSPTLIKAVGFDPTALIAKKVKKDSRNGLFINGRRVKSK